MEADRTAHALGRWRFGFAVVADSHLEPEVDGLALPRSNARNRFIVAQLRAMAPAFVVHLGDIVHPVPRAPAHDATLLLAHALYAPLACPVLYTPGNHDIGDKHGDLAPASSMTEAALQGYARVFGPPCAVHRHGDCHVVTLDSCVLNSGLPAEAAQRRWLEAQLHALHGQRLFLAMHYPLFLVTPDEASHYDHIDAPARHWLLDLIRRHRVEAVFCGHVHHFFWNRLYGTEFYVLPSTSFTRRDYSEMFRGAPTDEFGRNDAAKLGFFWVDVHDGGHVARFVRTGGQTTASQDLILPGHPKDGAGLPLGLWLRHPWCELTELPHNPPVDEFARRRARNDYAVQALWDFGVRVLRAPVDDLRDARVRARVADLVTLGHRFTFFSAGLPDEALLADLRAHAGLVARWECVLPLSRVEALVERVRPLVRDTGLCIVLSALRSGAQGNTGKSADRHFAGPGFRLEEVAQAEAVLRGVGAGVIGGLGFALPRGSVLDESLAALQALAQRVRAAVVVTCSMLPDGPNDSVLDDATIEREVRDIVEAARRHPGVEVMLDTFVDIDRGYYVRHGLVDRALNWRGAGRWLAQQAAALRRGDGA
jgi:3',5'-cyclic AMP phosphodiesterase CpdA